jgi:hypothetical protein
VSHLASPLLRGGVEVHHPLLCCYLYSYLYRVTPVHPHTSLPAVVACRVERALPWSSKVGLLRCFDSCLHSCLRRWLLLLPVLPLPLLLSLPLRAVLLSLLLPELPPTARGWPLLARSANPGQAVLHCPLWAPPGQPELESASWGLPSHLAAGRWGRHFLVIRSDFQTPTPQVATAFSAAVSLCAVLHSTKWRRYAASKVNKTAGYLASACAQPCHSICSGRRSDGGSCRSPFGGVSLSTRTGAARCGHVCWSLVYLK